MTQEEGLERAFIKQRKNSFVISPIGKAPSGDARTRKVTHCTDSECHLRGVRIPHYRFQRQCSSGISGNERLLFNEFRRNHVASRLLFPLPTLTAKPPAGLSNKENHYKTLSRCNSVANFQRNRF